MVAASPAATFQLYRFPVNRFVPVVAAATEEQLVALLESLAGRRFAVLTGAGCSTESGIPDYRGPGTASRARNPIQYRAFIDQPSARVRYWARSVVGWSRLTEALPNPAHHALAALERHGVTTSLITQNVDRLHHAAGSRRVVELHGALAEVRCLACQSLETRESLQQRLLDLNPNWLDHAAELAPDGDAELNEAMMRGFCVADCMFCHGILKPNVVFFGESVPRPVVDAAWQAVDGADALLVVGSSLTVYSGFRFVRGAAERGLPVVIINVGSTRGDALASLSIEARAAELLPRLAAALGAGDGASDC